MTEEQKVKAMKERLELIRQVVKKHKKALLALA